MSKKNLILMLVAHECYFKQCDSFKLRAEKGSQSAKISGEDVPFSPEEASFFQSVAETYVPLLNMLGSLWADSIPFKLSIVISPPLCALLSDAYLKTRYLKWLSDRIAFAEREVVRCSGNLELKKRAEKCLADANKSLSDYTDVYAMKLLEKFREYEKMGLVELLATSATHAFLPHFADIPEALNAQIEAGLISHRHFFGSQPDGFWLPYLGYCNPLARVLRSYNINYTVVDSRAVLFSQKRPQAGIFSPVRTDGFLSVLASDNDVKPLIERFKSSHLYRDEENDVGFELPIEELSPLVEADAPRIETGCKYYASSSEFYDTKKAAAQVNADAEEFVSSRVEKLTKARELLKDVIPEDYSAIDVCTINANDIGKNWHEGFSWLESVIRKVAASDIELSTAREIVAEQIKLQRLDLFPCAASGSGFGEDMLDSMNDRMLVYARTSSLRMIDLTERFPNDTGIKARLLNLASREILLSQSGDLPSLVHDSSSLAFAEKSFNNDIEAFSTVYDSLGSNSVSTEWLTSVEKDHPIFPWINYRIFSKKK